jgi:hypothetical protein
VPEFPHHRFTGMRVEFSEQSEDINGQSSHKKDPRKNIASGPMLNPEHNRRNENSEESDLIKKPDLPLFIVPIVDVNRGH